MTGNGSLSGVQVLDLSRHQPGAFCTRMLADLGADVVRVEPPRGDPLRGLPGAHDAYNHGKRSIALDHNAAGAPEVLRRLATSADVLLESGRPGAMGEQGIGYEQLATANPRLVWCSLTAFGQDGPHASRTGHDITFLGYSGLLSLMAGTTIPPTPDFVLAVPIGALMAVIGIQAALTTRERTGRGCMVDTSIVESASWLLSEHVVRVAGGGNAGWGPSPNRRAYRCADGRLVTLAAAEPRTWAALCATLGLDDLADDVYAPPDRQDAVAARLEALFATRPAAEWEAELADAGAGLGPVTTVDQLLEDPHLAARDAIVALDDGTRVLRSPVRLRDAAGATAPVPTASAPALGEHTDAVLAAAGYTTDEIAALHADGVV